MQLYLVHIACIPPPHPHGAKIAAITTRTMFGGVRYSGYDGQLCCKMDVVWRRKFGRKCHMYTNLNGVCANLVPYVTSEYQSGYYIVRINMPPMVCGSDHTASAAICKYTFLKDLIRTRHTLYKRPNEGIRVLH